MDTEGASSNPASSVIEHRAYARVGLLGNPSDVYYGRTISFTLGNFWASVRLQPSDELVIQPHPTHDLIQFRSLDHLVRPLSLCVYMYIFWTTHTFAWLRIYLYLSRSAWSAMLHLVLVRTPFGFHVYPALIGIVFLKNVQCDQLTTKAPSFCWLLSFLLRVQRFTVADVSNWIPCELNMIWLQIEH